MHNYLKTINPDFDHLQESAIADGNEIFGYHSTIFDTNGRAIAGGCAKTIDKSKRIAVAEFIERALVKHLSSAPISKTDFFLDKISSTCGFAAGFEREKTQKRAELEALERWAWSKWIDENYVINEVNVPANDLDSLDKFFLREFNRTRFFQLKHTIIGKEFKLGIVLGYSKKGIFPGSRAVFGNEPIWSHAILEAWRHNIISKNLNNTKIAPTDIIESRILYFSKNASAADTQITKAKKRNWPEAKFSLQREYNTRQESIYLFRALCENFVAWNTGSVDRFVY